MADPSDLDVSQAEKKLWLVKFPPMVANRLRAVSAQAGAEGMPVGKVRIIENADQVRNLKIADRGRCGTCMIVTQAAAAATGADPPSCKCCRAPPTFGWSWSRKSSPTCRRTSACSRALTATSAPTALCREQTAPSVSTCISMPSRLLAIWLSKAQSDSRWSTMFLP